ncbi:peptide-methionine (S)-S-oxide reductase MsrA [Vibrio zhugei]|uniref:Peptide methionine sulfoxide reductase MsrA n=1 Tax=Vibrio zhugei TaxID=2479546 RepID=A0ABV7C6G9_9VIBR|nr:peptide-methionine (S)-S-oxide reductase MsrA [Vibrio zhugei]
MREKLMMITADNALPGRSEPLDVGNTHFVNQAPLTAQPKAGQEAIIVAMGCFWGAERLFWQLDGVVSTSVGYTGGYTPNPTYQEVCSGQTGHTEAVRVIYDTAIISTEQLLNHFWESHDPTQGMRQGNDIGTQYRSAIYYFNEQQHAIAEKTKQDYQALLSTNDYDVITTTIEPAGPYYYAETYHQQYLAKNPQGYCGIGGTGVCFPPNRQD